VTTASAGSELEGHQLDNFFFHQHHVIFDISNQRELRERSARASQKSIKAGATRYWFFSRIPNFATFTCLCISHTLSELPTRNPVAHSNMFSKVLFVTVALVAFVAGSPVPEIENSCNTGSMQCCQFKLPNFPPPGMGLIFFKKLLL